MRVFLSYAKEDLQVVKKVYDDLQLAGIKPWIDVKEIQPGQHWRTEIHNAIKNSSNFIAFLSSNSVSKIGFVQKELKIALDMLEEFPVSDSFIIPIRIDECDPKDLKIKELHWVDIFPPSTYSDGIKIIIDALNNNHSKASKNKTDYNEEILKFNPNDFIGIKIEEFRITKIIGTGKYSTVFEAKHINLTKYSCIKIFHINPYFRTKIVPDILSQRSNILIKDIFFYGTRHLPDLKHNNIANVISSGICSINKNEFLYIISDYIKGVPLNTKVGKYLSREDIRLAVNIFSQICEGIKYAHELRYYNELGREQLGVLHGNIKPKNVVITEGNIPIITDFGIVNFQRFVKDDSDQTKAFHRFSDATLAFGTPGYMAPEQENDGIISRSTDIFSLGILFYEMFSGEKYIEHFSSINAIKNKFREKTINLPIKICSIIYKATDRSSKNRYKDVYEITTDIAKISNSKKILPEHLITKGKTFGNIIYIIALVIPSLLIIYFIPYSSIENSFIKLSRLITENVGVFHFDFNKYINMILYCILFFLLGLYLFIRKESVSKIILQFFRSFGDSVLYLSSKIKTILKTYQNKKMLKGIENEVLVRNYNIKRKIGSGGMSDVFIAENKKGDFKKVVVIKKLLGQFSNDSSVKNIFNREARLSANLNHPNIIQVFDFFDEESSIVMEYVEGKNLAEIFRESKNAFAIEQTVFIISKICEGLTYAHSKQIVHRDIKPSNILISFNGEVKISDFGISKAYSDPDITQVGVVKGTLSYMSPEQVNGQKIDHRSDIYSLGLIFYEMLTGSKVWGNLNGQMSLISSIKAISKNEIVPLKEKLNNVSDEIDSIVMRCLSTDLRKRYQHSYELCEDINMYMAESNIRYDSTNLSNFMKTTFMDASKYYEEDSDKTILRFK